MEPLLRLQNWKFSKSFRSNTQFWALVGYQIKWQTKECVVVFYYLHCFLFRILHTFCMWPTGLWNTCKAFVHFFQVLSYLFASLLKHLEKRNYSKVLIILKRSSTQVSPFSRSFLLTLTNLLIYQIVAGHKYPKSRRFFFKITRQVELLSRIVFTLVMKMVLQIVMLPKCIASYGAYFTTDLGSESFELPAPLW